MNNREIFRKNLNDLLSSSGKMQKDLAEFVGSKTTTVSGWTRGISYPRADAMEKIAMFFGVPTSRLVEPSDSTDSSEGDNEFQPKNDDVRLLVRGFNQFTPDEIDQAKAMMKIMFAKHAKYFEEEKSDDT
ncbi:MAG: helix-turn-helix transcriptional regulator [Clostridia bacterium]|nr:helix-turn-helix transcriptional regulator [Clostridia bacterium]